jgi:anthranilate synthase/aminodeoxychorismate synthase-like glutamine amidotransferase
MILLIDNYDSFVYNLARYVRELGETPLVCRNDGLTMSEIERMAPSHIIISPGPRSPNEAGVSIEAVRRFGPSIPVLGVCLGHQVIGAAYGAAIVRARQPMHGKVSRIHHDGSGIFAGLPTPFDATRYHSLSVSSASLPPVLRVTATADDGEIMALEHREHPVVGVQFHPESALTEHGYQLLDRFLHGNRSRADALPDRADGSWATVRTEPHESFEPPPVSVFT